MRILLSLLACFGLIGLAWAIHPGLDIFVAILCYWTINGLWSKEP